jgi:hypothetical protein
MDNEQLLRQEVRMFEQFLSQNSRHFCKEIVGILKKAHEMDERRLNFTLTWDHIRYSYLVNKFVIGDVDYADKLWERHDLGRRITSDVYEDVMRNEPLRQREGRQDILLFQKVRNENNINTNTQ